MENEAKLADWLFLIGVILAIFGGVLVTVSLFLRRRLRGKWQSVGLPLGALGVILAIVGAILY